jgi:hypothetical protein
MPSLGGGASGPAPALAPEAPLFEHESGGAEGARSPRLDPSVFMLARAATTAAAAAAVVQCSQLQQPVGGALALWAPPRRLTDASAQGVPAATGLTRAPRVPLVESRARMRLQTKRAAPWVGRKSGVAQSGAMPSDHSPTLDRYLCVYPVGGQTGMSCGAKRGLVRITDLRITNLRYENCLTAAPTREEDVEGLATIYKLGSGSTQSTLLLY